MRENKIISIEDRIPKLKQERKKKTNRRLIILMMLFFSLIAVIVYFQSPLSYVQSIEVTNNLVYSSEEIIAQSGLSLEDNIWSINRDEVILAVKHLPQIKSVDYEWYFPNKIKLNISEYTKIGYIYRNNEYIPVLENGKMLVNDKVDKVLSYAPILFSFDEGKVLEEMIKELEEVPVFVLNSISEIHSTPKESDSYSIAVYMNDGFKVIATIRDFAEKIQFYPDIIVQLDPTIKGVIDLEVGSFFKAYEIENTVGDNEEE